MIELLIVMSIIALLSGISIFALQGARSSGRDAKRKADLEDIRSALELYRADCSSYPTDGQVSFGSTLTGDNSSISCSSSNTYIEELPQDPSSSSSYEYEQTSDYTYCLCADLENDPTTTVSCGSLSSQDYCVKNP